MTTKMSSTHPLFGRFVQVQTELSAHRKAMRALKKEREALVSGTVAPEAIAASMATPSGPVFDQAQASAPAKPGNGDAARPMAMPSRVFEHMTKNADRIFSAETLATDLGLGAALADTVRAALASLVKSKKVTKVARGKYALVSG